MRDNDNIIGVVGGMGPMAGVELHKRIISNCPASKDQDHVSVVHFSYGSEIPDRSAFIDNERLENPAFGILKTIRLLESVGARYIGIPCNTAHAPQIFNVICKTLQEENSQVVLKNMIQETVDFIVDQYATSNRIGILGTNGTYQSKLFYDDLSNHGFEVVMPEINFQKSIIHRMVYDIEFGIKACNQANAQVLTLLDESLDFFKNEEVTILILGCTEFSMISKEYFKQLSIIDPLDILAKVLLKEVSTNNPLTSDIFYAIK